MHPYIAQIDDVAQGPSRGIIRQWWETHRVMLASAAVGMVASWALMHEGFAYVGLFFLALSMVGFVVPAVHLLVTLPIHLVLLLDPTDHNEIAQNTLHHTAVTWCEHDPSLTEVFAHFKYVFDKADAKTRHDLIWLLLAWEKPHGLAAVCISNEEAKRRFDVLFPQTIAVEATSTWRTFSKKYLRI